MANKTGIEWTDATWNPIRGCSRVSEGCRNCYAEKVAFRFSGPSQPYEGLVRINADGERVPQWNGQVQLVEKHLLDPLKWKELRRIFVNSMSDLFHENVSDEWIDRIFVLMALCPQHTFQVLTKRSERMLKYLTFVRRGDAWLEAWDGIQGLPAHCRASVTEVISAQLHNVRIGVSVENQKAADSRLDYVCELASQGWQTMVSFEPLLESVDPGQWWLSLGKKTWAIVGGESGTGARPMHPDWARSLRDQCHVAGVPFFFKQWGEWSPYRREHNQYGSPSLIQTKAGYKKRCKHVQGPDGTNAYMQCVGKKAAGAMLDGREWREFPEVVSGGSR